MIAYLWLYFCRSSFHFACYAVLDSGFCILNAFIDLKKHGVFAAVLIKRGKSQSNFVPWNAITKQCREKSVGSVDAISGVLNNIINSIWCMKESD